PSASLPCRVLVCLPTRRSSDLDAVQVLVGGLLIPQAAHQAAAAAADLGGVEGEALLLGHPDGDGLEVPQKAAAAEGLAEQADATHHLAIVTHADLAQIDPHMDGAGQDLDTLPAT